MTTRLELERLDDSARQAAQSVFDVPVVLEAGAGTGKTAVLVARIVSWCVGQGWRQRRATGRGGLGSEAQLARELLERVVALTFTDRAAAEMEQRVVQAFTSLGDGLDVIGFLPETSGAAPDQIRSRATALRAAADHMRVSTIHSFCRQVLAQFPLEAGVHPAFTVDGDGQAIARVVEQTVLERLRSCWGTPGDARYEQLAANGIGPVELADALRELFGIGAAEQLAGAEALSSARVESALARLRHNIAAWLEAIGDAFGARPSRGIAGALHAQAIAQTLAADLSGENELATLLTHARTAHSSVLGECLKRWARGRYRVAEAEHLGRRHTEVSSISASLRAQLANLARVEPQVHALAVEVLAELASDARARLRRGGVVAFPDLLLLTERLLSQNAGVRQRLRGRIDQLLVDEFQDTDATQCSILRLIALDSGPNAGAGLFLVGDPKQSIYGWRNADMAAYEGFVNRLEPLGGLRCALTRNFRSVPAILDEVERIVAPVMREERGIQPPFQPLICASPQPAEQCSFPAMEHWIAWDPQQERTTAARARELEATALAHDLGRMHDEQRVPWREMAVLMRTLTQQEPYLAALRAAGVPYLVERDQHYYRRREVVDAAALLRVVLDPLDEVALVTLLRSVVVGLPDAAFYALCSAGFTSAMAHVGGPNEGAVAAVERVVAGAADLLGQQHAGWPQLLRETVTTIDVLRGARATCSVEAWIEMVRAALPLELLEARRHLGEHRLARLESFFTMATEALLHDGGAEGLLRRLRLAVSGAEEADLGGGEQTEDSVRVMSIHKAKGLTFDCVYLMGIHSAGRSAGATETLVWGTLADGTAELSLLGRPSLGFDLLQQRRDGVAAAEAVRTLYVACTRPRRRLVVSGRWPQSGEGESSAGASQARPRLAGPGPAHVALLQQRAGEHPDLAQISGATAQPDQPRRVRDPEGVEWVVLGQREDPLAANGQSRAGSVDLNIDLTEPRRLWTQRLAADERMDWQTIRSVTAPATEQRDVAGNGDQGVDGAAALTLSERWRPAEGQAMGAPADAARVAGTAVHRVLELIDFAADIPAQLTQQGSRLDALIDKSLDPGLRTKALGRATKLLRQLGGASGLAARMSQIANTVLGREVPLLLQDFTGATRVGVIDLLYIDPETQQHVVADYKTDLLGVEEDLAQRARRYEPQGQAYQDALAKALALSAPPRFEVWFLWVDRIVTVESRR